MNKHVLKIHKELEETKARLARQHKRVSNLFISLNYFKLCFTNLHAVRLTHSWFGEGLNKYIFQEACLQTWSSVALRHQKLDVCSQSTFLVVDIT